MLFLDNRKPAVWYSVIFDEIKHFVFQRGIKDVADYKQKNVISNVFYWYSLVCTDTRMYCTSTGHTMKWLNTFVHFKAISYHY